MEKEHRSILFSIAILFALLFSAVHPSVVRADGGTTTPVGTQSPVSTTTPVPSTQVPVSTDTSVPSTQAPVSTDTSASSTQSPVASDTPVPSTSVVTDTVAPATTAAPTDVTPSTTDTVIAVATAAPTGATPSVTDTATATATATAQALTQVPDGTQITVVDGNGNVQPLATQAAANIIATSDPIWCPAGASPIAGTGGCTASYTDLYSLVNAIVTSAISQPNQNGTIWISAGTDTSASNITIDGSALTTWANYTLTLQGGWNGSSVGTISGTSDFSKSIGISNWKNDVVVNDVNVSNTNTTGLGVDTTGNITVHHVSSSNNTVHGAFLSTSGAGNQISVDNSTFNNNKLLGLNAMGQGNITLNNVIANNNTSVGVSLSNSSGIGNVSIAVNGTNTFNNNGLNGIQAYSNGNVTLNNVTANKNSNDGVSLNATYGTGSVTLTGTNQFNSNGHYGLDVLSKGNITLNTVTADGNANNGAYLDNTYGTGNLNVNSSTFSDNNFIDGRGLIAHSNGDITLAGVIASNNGGGGAELDNTTGSGGIILSGSNTFNDNGFNLTPSVGLYAVSNSNITLSGVTALGNGYDFGGGAFLGTADGSVSIANSNFSENCTTCQLGVGFAIFSTGSGDITLQGVTADNNGNDPANGYTGSTAAVGALIFHNGSNVFVANSDFSGNCALGDCSGGGIEILDFGTGGTVSFDHVTANGNGTAGSGSGAFIASTSNIDINCSTFNNNSGTGLLANMPGGSTITLNGVTLNGNTVSATDISGGGTLVTNSVNCGGTTGSHGGGLPIFIIPITGGLDCTSYSANKVVLPDQDYILLPCPISGDVTLTSQTGDQLPGKFDAKYTFVSAFDAKVTPSLTGSMIVSFKIPSDKQNANFTILYWDGSKWDDIGGTKTPDGFFQVQTDKAGTFVLVTK